MTEIAQLFESALRQNRATLLRKAAINTVAKMPATTKLSELLSSEAGASIRQLTLDELREALAGLVQPARPPRREFHHYAATKATQASRESTAASGPGEGESREVVMYKRILAAVEGGPKTIGQLSRLIACHVDELRGYLAWMKKMGKIESSGKARATRYHLPVGA